jgi:hypothetical protein
MFTVPLSMTGALLALNLTGTSLNIYSQIGLVTLIGLITKHGILIVQFANRLQGEGRSVHDAVVEAASLRLRPILMTTGAMVSGAIPLALASGAGAMGLRSVGWGDRRRHDVRHRPDAVRGADRVSAPLARPVENARAGGPVRRARRVIICFICADWSR